MKDQQLILFHSLLRARRNIFERISKLSSEISDKLLVFSSNLTEFRAGRANIEPDLIGFHFCSWHWSFVCVDRNSFCCFYFRGGLMSRDIESIYTRQVKLNVCRALLWWRKEKKESKNCRGRSWSKFAGLISFHIHSLSLFIIASGKSYFIFSKKLLKVELSWCGHFDHLQCMFYCSTRKRIRKRAAQAREWMVAELTIRDYSAHERLLAQFLDIRSLHHRRRSLFVGKN